MLRTQVPDKTVKIVGAIYRGLASDFSLNCLSLLNEGRYLELINQSIDPQRYADAWSFGIDWQAQALCAKSEFLDCGIAKQDVAYQNWIASEEACKVVNECGRTFTPIGVNPYERAIQRARELIYRLLGRPCLNTIYDGALFSGGASTSKTRRRGHPIHKYRSKPDVTPKAFPYAVAAVRADQQWFYSMVIEHGANPKDWFRLVAGNKMEFVPKNAKTDRTICKEPDMNMLLQRGIGRVIRRKLQHVRINLNSQWLNQHYAKIGSSTGSLATLDLSAASDSISLELVRDLLPHDWFELIEDLRSPYTVTPDGTFHKNQKVSSMGNGYTFELESLIFWALTQASVEMTRSEDKRVAIYGDDIICHHTVCPFLMDLLSYCGFTVNESKSFVSGPFRESCGKHYFYGADVTPIYLKKRLNCVTQLYRLHNGLSDAFTGGANLAAELRYIASGVPNRLRLRVPRHFGNRSGFWNPVHGVRQPRVHNGLYRFVYLASLVTRAQPGGWAALHYTLGYYHNESSGIELVDGDAKLALRRGLAFSMEQFS